MLDFYQIVRLNIVGHGNSTVDSTQIEGDNSGKSRYEFLLAQVQRGQDADDTYVINPIRKTFRIRALILQVGTTCELPLSQTAVPDNKSLPAVNIFEDMNDLINSPIRRNFNVVYDKIEEIECSKCDYKKILCFTWKIEKQWCLIRTSNIQGNQFIQFNTGFFWFVTALDINESLRYLKFISDKNERTRYNVGTMFAPSHDDGYMRGPCATVLEYNLTYRWIDLNQNSALAISRLGDQIADLKQKLDEQDEEQRKKNKNSNSVKPTTTPIINFISCPICKNEFKESKIQQHLKEYIKNPLSKDTVCDKLGMKKQSIAFDKMKELVSKLTDIQVKELVDKIQKLIETYGEKFIEYIPDEMKEQILYNFDKIMIGIIERLLSLNKEITDLRTENNDLSIINRELQDEIKELRRQLLSYQNSNYILLETENKDLKLTNEQLLIKIQELNKNNSTSTVILKDDKKLSVEIKKLSTLIDYFSTKDKKLQMPVSDFPDPHKIQV
ncbi:9517_t:CDS:2 [Racocetra fulgida]|uniref:9517_t:CDS:1 n=1 Tax=Racocetra fulgida TaxID=60492 RepID=A0A9N8ZE03_9GLOM|nr:9517_t:CDS:2 [Racocetra fulgida]